MGASWQGCGKAELRKHHKMGMRQAGPLGGSTWDFWGGAGYEAFITW